MNNNQRDARWANIPVGSGDQTIGQVGCTITVIGDILGLTPPEVNEALKRVNGFSVNLVIWAKIAEAFPGTTVKRVWSYNNDDVLANVPNVIVEVPATPIGGRGSHWVRYIGNHQLDDPWTGITRPTSDFPSPTGYCVIIPKIAPQPAPTPQPPTTPPANTLTEFGVILNVYRALCGVDPTQDEINYKINEMVNGKPLSSVMEDIIQGDVRFKTRWSTLFPLSANTPRQDAILAFFKGIGIS